jgi:hypothetical protein
MFIRRIILNQTLFLAYKKFIFHTSFSPIDKFSIGCLLYLSRILVYFNQDRLSYLSQALTVLTILKIEK